MRKIWIIPLIILVVIVATVVVFDRGKTIHSIEKCKETKFPCIYAVVGKEKVKVINGTSTFDQEDGTTIMMGDVFPDDIDNMLDTLKVKKKDLVTLDFLNQKPNHITVFQLKDYERLDKVDIDLNTYTFTAPTTSGTFMYEIYGEYENAVVHHYLKIKVR
ncbi:hypothetical protein [Ornithinibacillus bavariensis]|uniref:Uncharacterized protein n=1 Tax=Ornithinibacillus bavariensis TaxID=545502 RepID=A0A920C653_9BACI|nr:hypothetical protein [Ornithinibacillus bavariensis]GIO27551.1 hypothetical protein J43TS3_21620 [Ornithinibacillus bavariensis]